MSPEGMDMQASQHSPGDPFIGSNGGSFPSSGDTNASTLHTKQESGDSGLGGMGNTFSLARTAGEEFMEATMDDGRVDSNLYYISIVYNIQYIIYST